MEWLTVYNLNQFHNKMLDRKQALINMPDVNSSKYKMNLREIEESVRSMNSFTDHLEEKVAMMLKGQQTQFVNSYKNHMNTVEQALKDYEQRIAQYQKKVQYYENQGVLATLLNKIHFLQDHQRKLLDKLDRKDRTIFDLKNQITTQHKEIKSLHERIKQLLRSTQNTIQYRQTTFRQQKESERTFATEVPALEKSILRSNQSIERINSTQAKYSTIGNPQDRSRQELSRARHQVETMKKRNRELSSMNSRIIDKVGQADQFFLNVVNQLKKKVSVRKNFKQCSFEDFRQEDKVELLVKVLSNDQILNHLYQKIFHKPASLLAPTSDCLDPPRNMLPAISTARK